MHRSLCRGKVCFVDDSSLALILVVGAVDERAQGELGWI